MDWKKILEELSAPFPASEIEWRVGSTTQDKKRGLAFAYISNRAIIDRLNDVVGAGNWQNELKPFDVYVTVQKRRNEEDTLVKRFKEIVSLSKSSDTKINPHISGEEQYSYLKSAVICGISIWDDEKQIWVTKWDGSDLTDFEPVKGGISGSMKRAAVQWGIGRYLYNLPDIWVDLEPTPYGTPRIKGTPSLPGWALPSGSGRPSSSKELEKPVGESEPAQEKGEDDSKYYCEECGAEITSDEAGYSQRFFKKKLCREHQNKYRK